MSFKSWRWWLKLFYFSKAVSDQNRSRHIPSFSFISFQFFTIVFFTIPTFSLKSLKIFYHFNWFLLILVVVWLDWSPSQKHLGVENEYPENDALSKLAKKENMLGKNDVSSNRYLHIIQGFQDGVNTILNYFSCF